ncbi:MAG: hypothetical protein LBP53_00855 [Candidatus Peribacteria bacterium]|nr:hypothetical protein [Candidatus Peribacteria bacterium]
MFFDATKGRIVISGGLVVGAIGGTSGNSIAKGALNSIILGGIHNTIGAKGITSTIGAGQDNIVNARTASIGAGY